MTIKETAVRAEKNGFRPLDANEQAMLHTLAARYSVPTLKVTEVDTMKEKWQVRFLYQGNFTIAMLLHVSSGEARIGVAKRNCGEDAYNPTTGRRQALRRAFMSRNFLCRPSLLGTQNDDETQTNQLRSGEASSAAAH